MAQDPQKILTKLDAEERKIQAFADITAEAKSRRTAEAREQARGEFAAAKAEEKERIEAKVTSSRKGVYGVPTEGAISSGEVAQVHAAFWSFWNEVKAATSDPSVASLQEELSMILKEAERFGLSLLSHACYCRGLDLGIQPIIDAYLENRPKETRAYERYLKALTEANEASSIGHLFSDALTGQAMQNG